MPDKIIITIPRKKKKPSRSGGISRGLVRTKKKSEYLSRRRKAGGITFYDMGQVKIGGNWVTNPFSQELSVSGPPESEPTISSVPDAGTAADALALLLSVNASDRETAFRRIQKAHLALQKFVFLNEFEEILIDENYEGIDAGGSLTLPPEYLNDPYLTVAFGQIENSAVDLGYFDPRQVGLGSSAVGHVTNEPDPMADNVNFTPSDKDKYFLIPSIRYILAHSQFKYGGGVDQKYFFNAGYSTQFFPRYVDEPDKVIEPNSANLAILTAGFDTLNEQPNIRAWVFDAAGATNFAPISPTAIYPNQAAIDDFATIDINYHLGLGMTLSLIIKQGSTWFYFWSE